MPSRDAITLEWVSEAALARWQRAMHWKRAILPGLTAVGLTFRQWLVLKTCADLIHSSGDAVCQAAVARQAHLDRTSTSRTMQALSDRGFVDRGPDMERHEYRVWVTGAGLAALQSAARHVNRASSAGAGNPR